MKIKNGALASLILLVCATPAMAQDRFSDLVEVTEVEVPVRVLVKGKPLAGLQQDDFELYDEGELQTIVGFRAQEQSMDRPQESPQGDDSRGLDTDRSGRRLLLLFDFSFSRPQRLASALRGIRTGLAKQLDPEDRVAVATYGYVSGVNLLVGFTRDREVMNLAFDAIKAMLDAKGKKQREILAQLHEIRFPSDGGTQESSTYASLAHELGASAALGVLSGPVVYDEAEDDGVIILEQESVWSPIQVRVEVDVRDPIFVAQDVNGVNLDTSTIRHLGLALTELTTLLRDVGGQKDMILVSEGFSGALLENARSMFFLQKAFRSFRDSGWVLHSVDVGGIPGMDDRSFESGSLLFMADATGGDLVENTNDFSQAAARVLQRTEVVYVLAFQPQESGKPGEFRRLEVKLKNAPKGADVRHRPGYYTSRPLSERGVFEARMDAAQWLMTNLEADEIDVRVFAQNESDPLGGIRVPVAVEITGESLGAMETKKPTSLELQLAALDTDSQVKEILSGEIEIRFSDMAAVISQGGVRFVGELGLSPGEYQLRVLVRSSRQGQVFLGTFPLAVGSDAEEVLPPLPPESQRGSMGWLTVQADRHTAYFQ